MPTPIQFNWEEETKVNRTSVVVVVVLIKALSVLARTPRCSIRALSAIDLPVPSFLLRKRRKCPVVPILPGPCINDVRSEGEKGNQKRDNTTDNLHDWDSEGVEGSQNFVDVIYGWSLAPLSLSSSFLA